MLSLATHIIFQDMNYIGQLHSGSQSGKKHYFNTVNLVNIWWMKLLLLPHFYLQSEDIYIFTVGFVQFHHPICHKEEQAFSLFSLEHQTPRGAMEGTNSAHSAFCSDWQGSVPAVEGHSDSWGSATAACKS